MRVSELYDRGRPVFSFEFFPPKTDKGVDALFRTLTELAPLAPDFVSVTCPLDKPRRPLTFGLVARIKDELGIEAMAHLVTVDYTRGEIDAVLRQLRRAGIENVLALRGDLLPGMSPDAPRDFQHAAELAGLAQREGFCVGGAAHPELHPESRDWEGELRHAADKVRAGCSFLVTQLFFDCGDYLRYVERARRSGIAGTDRAGHHAGRQRARHQAHGRTEPQPHPGRLPRRARGGRARRPRRAPPRRPLRHRAVRGAAGARRAGHPLLHPEQIPGDARDPLLAPRARPLLSEAPMEFPAASASLVARAAGAGRILSNGELSTLLGADGTGFMQLGWRRITSREPDPRGERDGVFLYLRDEDDGAFWSVGLEPVAGAPLRYEATSGPGRLCIVRVERGIEAECEALVAADAHVELRRVRLRNLGGRPRRLALTSCAGVVLHHAGAHAGHPAFSKLFVQTQVDRAAGLLLARRRPRGPEPEPLVLAHALFGPGAASFEADRARFIGRGRSLARPAALAAGSPLSGTVGNVLDPILSWRRELTLAPGASAELVCVLALGESEALASQLALRFGDPAAFAAAREGAERRATAELARCGLAPEQGEYLQGLLAALLAGAPELRAPAEVLRRVRGAPGDLWSFGLPPDQPLAVVEAGPRAAVLQAELEVALGYWRALGHSVRGLALGGASGSDAIAVAKPDAETRLLDSARAMARLWLRDAWPPLAAPAPEPGAAHRASDARAAAPVRAEAALLFANGCGGFDPGGREYVIDVACDPEAPRLPPMPWCNIMANEGFGTLVSERGAATTWSRNSREHRLTPWSNDPIADPHDEALWVRDESAHVFWSPQPGPTPAGGGYEVRHGFGYSSWRHRSHALLQEVTTQVAQDAPLKLTRVRLTNLGGEVRQLSVFGLARLVQGVLPEEIAHACVVDPSRRRAQPARAQRPGRRLRRRRRVRVGQLRRAGCAGLVHGRSTRVPRRGGRRRRPARTAAGGLARRQHRRRARRLLRASGPLQPRRLARASSACSCSARPRATSRWRS